MNTQIQTSEGNGSISSTATALAFDAYKAIKESKGKAEADEFLKLALNARDSVACISECIRAMGEL